MIRDRAMTPVIALALGVGIATLLMLSLGGTSATAQDACTDDFGQFDVSTAAEFNAAIDCFNGLDFNSDLDGVTVTLINDIAVESFTGSSLLTEITHSHGLELLIDGSGNDEVPSPGFTIRRGLNVPTTPASIISMAPGSMADFSTASVGFEVGPFDTAAIRNNGLGDVNLLASSIIGIGSTNATGIVAGPDAAAVLISGSYIDGVRTGIEVQDAGFQISSSTIISTGTDVLMSGGLSGIVNSTLGGPTGIDLATATVRVEHTTILGDVAHLTAASTGVVVARSSFITSCSMGILPVEALAGSGLVDLTNNVGRCFNPDHDSPWILADNGCANVTPAGCPPTAAAGQFSVARGAGDCRGIFNDQRGEPRSPRGLGCEAGAYELPANGSCPAFTTTFAVATAAEFNQAVACFNANDPDPQQLNSYFAIELSNDIVVDDVGDLAVLDQFDSAYFGSVSIRGNGFTISRSDTAAATSLPVLSIRARDNLFVEVTDLGIDLAPADTVGLQIFGPSSGSLLFEGDLLAIAASPDSDATGIFFDDQVTAAEITDSLIDGTAIGIDSAAIEDQFIFGSTIRSSETAVQLDSAATQSVTYSTLVAPTSLITGPGVSFIGFSTLTGEGYSKYSYSSIINSCAQPVNDYDGGNVGGCFVPGQAMDTELADNGCVRATPAGCPMTIALTPGAPALGAGQCLTPEGEIAQIDGRGFPRTPLGPGCDSGAFEAPGVIQGDIDNDGTVDNDDVQALLGYLAGDAATLLLDAADIVPDDEIRLDDALALAQQIAG